MKTIDARGLSCGTCDPFKNALASGEGIYGNGR